MNRFSALLVVSLALLHQPAVAATDDQHECCLCNDCDMMMNAEASVYDLDEGRLMSCSDFAELVFDQVRATSETCHMIQGFYQDSCCMNANLQQKENNPADPALAAAVGEVPSVSRRHTLQQHELVSARPLSVPFSRRELQWAVSNGWTAKVPVQSYGYQSYVAPAQTSFSYAPPNTNGNALGCSVPASNNAKVVNVYRSTNAGFSAPTGINCSTASQSGIGMSASDSMYQVSLKCVRCNCCGACTGLDANVCVGNNQPRPNTGSAVNSWWVKK